MVAGSAATESGVIDARARARFVVVALLVFLCVVVVMLVLHTPKTITTLRVVFFDVGQGDAIFVQSPTGVQVLIDGGSGSAVLRGLSHELGFFDREIDLVVATHEDNDHVGGLPEVFRRYRVGALLRTENQGESTAAHLIDTLAIAAHSDIIYARRGERFDLGAGVVLTVIFPDRDPTQWESNTSSIVARLTYGDSEFLLTGDSPQSVEEYLVGLGAADLRSDVLKLGHHGSRTSSSVRFVDAVRPTFAIVSAGKDNRYGHPHQEALDAARAVSSTILSTAEEGSIAFEADGNAVRKVAY